MKQYLHIEYADKNKAKKRATVISNNGGKAALRVFKPILRDLRRLKTMVFDLPMQGYRLKATMEDSRGGVLDWLADCEQCFSRALIEEFRDGLRIVK